jgi:adenylate cyclase
LGAGLTGGLAFAFASPVRALIWGLLWPAATIGGSIHLFQTSGFFISPIYAVLVTSLSGLVLTSLRLISAGREKDRRHRTFAGRVAPEMAARLARLEDDQETVQEREVTVMTAALQDLQTLDRPPAEILERDLAPLTSLVLTSRGTLDHFRGDAILAFWNAPLPVADHPAVAVAAALALREAKGQTGKVYAPRPPKISLGIHTGSAWTGRLGPSPLERYTLLGEAVSLSIKLERMSRSYGVDTVVSGVTRQACGEAFTFQPLDILRLGELEPPLAIFAPLGPEEARVRAEELGRQAEVLVFYREGEFQKARMLFRALAARHPEFGLYEIFARRCARLFRETPAEWAGVWNPGSNRPVLELE